MTFEGLKQYSNLVVDYSIIKELAGTPAFNDFIDTISKSSMDIYVSKAFKLLHYSVIHQAGDTASKVAGAMKEFCGILLVTKKLHSVPELETCDFIRAVSGVENCCFITAEKSIFVKRLLEKKPDLKADICIYCDSQLDFYHGIDDLAENMPVDVISPLASLDKYLSAPVFCNVGDSVTTGSGKTITLTKRISNGAEGMVFFTDNPRLVAKIYHKNVITPLRWSKLSTMVSMDIQSIGICWPHDLLFYKGVPVGYTMNLGKGKTLGNVFDGPDAIFTSFPTWKRVDVVNSLVQLLEKYIYLHMFNIIAGDIQLKNALIQAANSIYLIDMDSVQVGNLPCPVGTEEFTDPRLWGKNFSGFLRNMEDEDYSISMMVFSVLFCGLHPYATRNGAETLREEILEKNFPYKLDCSDEEHIPRGGYNYIWNYLPADIKTMLYGVFKEGKSYETIEWYDVVVTYRDALAAKAFEDPECYNVFPKMDYRPPVVVPDKKEEEQLSENGRFMHKTTLQNALRTQPVPLKPLGSSGGSVQSSPVPSGNSIPGGGQSSGGYSPFAPKDDTPSSPFAPLGSRDKLPLGNNVPAPSAPSQDDNSSSGRGIFGRFRRD